MLSFDEVRRALLVSNQTYLGKRVIDVKNIVGSVGRQGDFDRSFLPTRASVAARWKRIDRAFHRSEELPPVRLYKIEDHYFVLDGNHRVSVARYHGAETIDAEVIELRAQAHRLRATCSRTRNAPGCGTCRAPQPHRGINS